MLLGIAPLISSYINLLNIRLFAQVSGLCVSAIGNVTVTNPGFVLIVSLVISLWLYRSGRIIDRIVLIASLWSLWLLWPYCWLDRWLYYFDCIALIALIALTVSLVMLLISLLWLLRSSCLKVFSAFDIILTICSSNCKRPKTEFISSINHALASNHPPGSICLTH